ncbi:MAG: hypothetical protein HY554_13070 [Elusimicrobia bacterium]|nr:hypothetical protein [Elusimicrobiota bacterium]
MMRGLGARTGFVLALLAGPAISGELEQGAIDAGRTFDGIHRAAAADVSAMGQAAGAASDGRGGASQGDPREETPRGVRKPAVPLPSRSEIARESGLIESSPLVDFTLRERHRDLHAWDNAAIWATCVVGVLGSFAGSIAGAIAASRFGDGAAVAAGIGTLAVGTLLVVHVFAPLAGWIGGRFNRRHDGLP